MTPIEYCRDKAAASGSSFYYSFLFLPPARRDAIMAFYAFCREVDDVADEVSDTQLARTKLAWWRTEIDRLYAGSPTHPVTQALQAHVLPFGVRAPQLMEVIAGMEMDVNQVRYPDLESLKIYCHRVAGVVGEVSALIFGYANPSTHDYAGKLGLALQLVNILRDVGDDAPRGRVYLTDAWLKAHGVDRNAVLQRQGSPALTALLRELAELARTAFRDAARALPAEDVRSQRAGLIMGRIYRELLEEIAREDFAVLNQRIALTPLRKLWLAWKGWVFPRAALRALGR
ncbi:phytoene synthase [beta proteobacterium AAP99]|nr:phytoene synthase [beta proteobacterium AAP99]